MASGVEGASEFHWLDGETVQESEFHFLKEGYLNMAEAEGEGEGVGGKPPAHSTVSRDQSMKSWKKRWCLLSQTAEGVSLLYYNKQSSFTNCEAPCGVVLMRECNRLYTIPHHPKSSNMFAIEFPNRTIHFYTDRDQDLDPWLIVLQSALNLKDTSGRARLKGLPKQKAMRKNPGSSRFPPEHTQVVIPAPSVNNSNKDVPSPKEAETGEDINIQGLSFKPLSDAPKKTKKKKEAPPQPDLKGLPKQKAMRKGSLSGRHNGREESYSGVDVPDLDSEENQLNVKFLSFKVLDT